ncbi:kWG [Clostridium sp. CAG:452]|jgi:cytochrome oxidase Cu insertion factor (SCO1/SenC/PrrC family)|nr:kWG [Clostridium sp. CAG:452]
MSSKGRRYNKYAEPKLNMKKVLGVIVAILVIIMVIVSIVNVIKNGEDKKKVKSYSYYTVYENGKFGVINNEGETVINPEYTEIVLIPNKDVPIFICTYDLNDQDGTYKTKVINQKNEEIFKEYSKVEAIDNFDSKQNIWYEDDVLRVEKDEKYGLINFEGKEVLPCDYDEITALKGVTNNLLVKKDGKVGLVNEKGQTIVNTEYKDIKTLKEGYKNEYIIVNDNNQYGIISTTGTVIIEPKYEDVKYLNNSEMFAIKDAGVWKLINKDNQILIDGGYDNIIEAKGENVVVEKGGKYGVVTTKNEEKIPVEYEQIKYTFSIYYIAKTGGKYGIINLNNEQVKDFNYINMDYVEKGDFIQADVSDTETVIFDNNLSEKINGIVSEINQEKGYIKVYTNNEYKYYNFKFEEKKSSDILTSNNLFLSKKDGKYGYVNKEGKVIVDYIYEDGTEQNSCGFAAVKKDGVWGSINKVGAVELEPSVNLDSNIYTTFIGKWHLNDSGLYYEK